MPDPLATITFNPIIDDYLAAHALALTATTRHFRQWARIMLCIASWSATAVSLAKIAQDRYTPGEDETPPRGFAVVMKG
jgi:hypothetical protein